MYVVFQILSALCYLHGGNPHRKTYIHRDLKPSNVFFKDGIVKVGDFGLVKPGDALTGILQLLLNKYISFMYTLN